MGQPRPDGLSIEGSHPVAFLLGIVVGALICVMSVELSREYLRRRSIEKRRLQAERLNAILQQRVNDPREQSKRLALVQGYDDTAA